ncbi:MAG: DNA double-strand break repair nuclease NurA [Hyphomicrobiales bacterium]|nr:MAG: DNA double-strand break repair nuclease NurA [Hyphomicrobiales bacterium]
MVEFQHIRRVVEAKVSQGAFLSGMMHVARKQSSQTQKSFVDQLSGIAATVRGVLETNDLIGRVEYRPQKFWPAVRGKAITFLDGGVANIELPSAAPVGIRVGSYTVRPGEHDPLARERFSIDLSIVDDLYSEEGYLYDSDFLDFAKLRDAARIVSETAAVLQHATRLQPADAILLHGPLINPVSPYGLEGFPPFGLGASRQLLGDEAWEGGENERQFVALYLLILERIRDTDRLVMGVVERSLGTEPVVIHRLLDSLQDAGVMKKDNVKALLESLRLYGLNDAAILDVVLQEGEFTKPAPIDRQGPESKWPTEWTQWIRTFPKALTSYLKPSELTSPFRIEAFEGTKGLTEAIDLVLHTARLLPSYGFPVGLDIVDKFAKVPEWMSRGIRGQHQIVLLQKAIESGDPRAVAFAKRVLAAKGRDWFFRPTA